MYLTMEVRFLVLFWFCFNFWGLSTKLSWEHTLGNLSIDNDEGDESWEILPCHIIKIGPISYNGEWAPPLNLLFTQ